jgi:glycosyltransferase involved in cell wall biosynthesis
MTTTDKLISIVVPAYNEAEVLPEFQRRVAKVIDDLPFHGEICYVNDGSTDDTFETLKRLQKADSRVVIIDLSRNYGKEIAITAGLDHACGDATIPIDADLQDPPELIKTLVEKWQEGYNVVYARRISREGETWVKRFTAFIFYRLMHKIGGKLTLPENVGDFRLIDRKALDALIQLREHHRFMKGLFTLIGFRQTVVDYHRDSRFAGETKWSYWQLWGLSLEAITSFTIVPLKISTYIGILTAFFAFLYGVYIFGKTILIGDPVPGYPSLMVMIAFLGGVQLTVLGIIGEYLGRIFTETKNRPLYFVMNLLKK